MCKRREYDNRIQRIKQEHESKRKGQPLQWASQKTRKELLNNGNQSVKSV